MPPQSKARHCHRQRPDKSLHGSPLERRSPTTAEATASRRAGARGQRVVCVPPGVADDDWIIGVIGLAHSDMVGSPFHANDRELPVDIVGC